MKVSQINFKLVPVKLLFHDMYRLTVDVGRGRSSSHTAKTKGSGVKVSDYIDEHNGFLRLSEKEYVIAKIQNPDFPKVLMKYGAQQEG